MNGVFGQFWEFAHAIDPFVNNRVADWTCCRDKYSLTLCRWSNLYFNELGKPAHESGALWQWGHERILLVHVGIL